MSTSRPHPYAAFLSRVAKPARYVGGEHGATKKAWDDAEARKARKAKSARTG